MAFTVQDLHDLIVLLEQHPEWKTELRRVLLGDELLRLPELVEELGRRVDRLAQTVEELAQTVNGILESLKVMSERQERFDERQERFEQRQERFDERQERFEQRQERFDERQERFEQRQERFDERQERFEQRQERFDERQERFEQRQDRMERDMAELKGMTLEIWYARRMPAIFGRWLRGGKEATNLIAQRLKEAVLKGLITQEDADEVLNADVFWSGKFNGKEVFLIGEVSWKVEANDVERVARRTAIAQQAVLCAVGFAAGQEWAQEAIVMAQQLSVLQVQGTRLIDVTPLQKVN